MTEKETRALEGIGYLPSECVKLSRQGVGLSDGDVVEVDITGGGEHRKKYYTQQKGRRFSTKVACSTPELEKKKIKKALEDISPVA
ncbi:MAG: hypothetical protein LBU27_03450 [Candidatus Peribacteria bacterium]|jgi:hypothetical protein|nr:hypothetical protein [Candidatus Peribacteria bacterium]